MCLLNYTRNEKAGGTTKEYMKYNIHLTFLSNNQCARSYKIYTNLCAILITNNFSVDLTRCYFVAKRAEVKKYGMRSVPSLIKLKVNYCFRKELKNFPDTQINKF